MGVFLIRKEQTRTNYQRRSAALANCTHRKGFRLHNVSVDFLALGYVLADYFVV